MDPERIWQSVLDQLQMDMPMSTFNNYVRDARVLDFNDNILWIGVHNSFIREWLEDRLTAVIERILIGILDSSGAQVRFTIIQNAGPDDQPPGLNDAQDDDRLVEISATEIDSAYDRIARPHVAVVLPSYFRRWLQYLGPDYAWMYVGFRQAAYRVGGRSGSKLERFSGATIASLCGIRERTFWNRVKNPNCWEKLNGLVTSITDAPEWVEGSLPRRLPRRYVVSMTLPLTPQDTLSLRVWILNHIEIFGGPEAVLQAAADTPLDRLLQPRQGTDPRSKPETVRQIITGLFRGQLSADQIDSLAARLQNHIMPPLKGTIHIPVFFIEHVLPHLGAGPGWMVTLLRDRCWVNHTTGETRNRVKIQGGYDEIALALGLTGARRARTVWDWLNAKYGPNTKESGKFKNPISKVYMREISDGRASSDFATSPRVFQVLLEDIPHQILELALTGGDLDAIFSINSRDDDATFSVGLTQFSEDDDASFSIALTQFSEDLDAICRVFKPLNLSQSAHEFKKEPPTTSKYEDSDVWSFSNLLKYNQVNPNTGSRLISMNASCRAFVSWLLYVHSPKGKDLGIGFAISMLISNPQTGAGGGFDGLADWSPVELSIQIERAISSNPMVDELFKTLFRRPNGYDLERLKKLKLALYNQL